MASSKNKNAGLVGPAHSLFMHLWGATVSFCPRGSFLETRLLQKLDFRQTRLQNSKTLRTEVLAVTDYITSARPSSSFCSTGRAQPDISTRPTASRAACGDTP